MSIDKKFIGKKYTPYVYEVGKEKLMEYARAIKCTNRHYFDEAFAKATKYGAIIAPPTFAVVYAANVIEPIFTDTELNLNMNMLVQGEQEFEFFEVIKSGDVLTVESHISNIENKGKVDIIAIEVNAVNQHNRRVNRGTYTFVERQ